MPVTKFRKSPLALAMCMLAAPVFATSTNTAQDSQPNVLMIVVDDLALPDISAYGHHLVPTPNIDKLAQDGVLFTNGYVAASVSAVSRAAILTGRSPQRFGFTYNIHDKKDADKGLPADVPTIGKRLKTHGYNTNAIGKWHQGFNDEFYPTNRGFDDFYGFLTGETIYVSQNTPGIVTTPTKFDYRKKMSYDHREPRQSVFQGKERKVVNNLNKYLTDDFTDVAVQYLNEQEDKKNPFFLYLAYNAPHYPLQVPQDYYDKFSDIKDPVRRTYVAMISNLDDNIGRVMETLEKTGQDQNTMIFFISDNGCPIQFGFCDCSDPLGSGKFTYVEGGVHVPYIFSWKGKIKPNQRVDSPVSSIDMVPTILSHVAKNQDLPAELDGLDLLSVIKEPEAYADRKMFFSQTPLHAMRDGKYKLWISDDQKKTELYDLDKDLAERHNIAAQHPEVIQKMQKALHQWNQENPKPLWNMHRTFPGWKTCTKDTEGVY